MNAGTHEGPATPAKLRRILIVVLVLCGLLGLAGYFYGGWLLEHPPTKEQAQPGH